MYLTLFYSLLTTCSTMPHVMSYQGTTSSRSSVLTSSSSCLATWSHSPHEWLWLVKSSKVRHPSKSRGMGQSTTFVRLRPKWSRSGANWSTMVSSTFQLGMSSFPRTSLWSLLHPRMPLKYQCWFRYAVRVHVHVYMHAHTCMYTYHIHCVTPCVRSLATCMCRHE